MALPQDWAFTRDHTDLDETGLVGSGEQTLLDFACTTALTSPGTLPQDAAFGLGLSDQLGAPLAPAREIGERLRGRLTEDDRVADVSTDASTTVGALTLPVRIEASSGPYRLSGPLTPELIEEIVADEEAEDEE